MIVRLGLDPGVPSAASPPPSPPPPPHAAIKQRNGRRGDLLRGLHVGHLRLCGALPSAALHAHHGPREPLVFGMTLGGDAIRRESARREGLHSVKPLLVAAVSVRETMASRDQWFGPSPPPRGDSSSIFASSITWSRQRCSCSMSLSAPFLGPFKRELFLSRITNGRGDHRAGALPLLANPVLSGVGLTLGPGDHEQRQVARFRLARPRRCRPFRDRAARSATERLRSAKACWRLPQHQAPVPLRASRR